MKQRHRNAVSEGCGLAINPYDKGLEDELLPTTALSCAKLGLGLVPSKKFKYVAAGLSNTDFISGIVHTETKTFLPLIRYKPVPAGTNIKGAAGFEYQMMVYSGLDATRGLDEIVRDQITFHTLTFWAAIRFEGMMIEGIRFDNSLMCAIYSSRLLDVKDFVELEHLVLKVIGRRALRIKYGDASPIPGRGNEVSSCPYLLSDWERANPHAIHVVNATQKKGVGSDEAAEA